MSYLVAVAVTAWLLTATFSCIDLSHYRCVTYQAKDDCYRFFAARSYLNLYGKMMQNALRTFIKHTCDEFCILRNSSLKTATSCLFYIGKFTVSVSIALWALKIIHFAEYISLIIGILLFVTFYVSALPYHNRVSLSAICEVNIIDTEYNQNPIIWLPILFTSPGHQQPWYWLCGLYGSWDPKIVLWHVAKHRRL